MLTTQPLAFGETLTSLARRTQIPGELLVRLNRITSPGELYAGTSLIIPQEAPGTSLEGRAGARSGRIAAGAGGDERIRSLVLA